MNIISLVYYVFTFAFGVGTLFTYILTVMKTKSSKLFHILVFYIVFTLSMFFNIYYTVTESQQGFLIEYRGLIGAIAILTNSLFIFSVPLFAGYIAFVKHQKVRNTIFAILSLLVFIHSLLKTFLIDEVGGALHAFLTLPLFSFCLIIAIAYAILCGLINLKKIVEPEDRALTRNVCIVALLFFPFNIVNVFADFIIPVDPLLFCSFCVVFISYIFRIYFRDYHISKEEVEAERLEGYNLSDREREVLDFVLQGYSNQKIADILFISISTVKTHIHNLFKKTGTSNRYELIHLIKFK